MSFQRGATPLFSTSAPSLEAANQLQINDLIQRNRTLEHMNHKLSAQLAEEVNRSKASVKEIQDKHEANQRLWKESCEDVLASYRIIQKRLEVELEKERYATLQEMEVGREEKLKRIQRDYKLKLFQMNEEKLENRLEEIGEERYDLQGCQEAITQKWKDQCIKYATKLRDAQEALERNKNENQDKESKLNKLRESHANLDAEKETFTAKLKRAQLNLGHEQDKNRELTTELNEAKRRIKELTRQVDEWHQLEHTEGAEIESHRKKRMALEQQVQDLTEKHDRELTRLQRSLEKECERGEKTKETRDRLEEEAKDYKKEADKANNLVKRLEKKLEKLKEDLEAERARVRPASHEETHLPSTPNKPVSEDVEIEEIPQKGTIAKPSSKRRTVKAGLTNKFADDEVGTKKQVGKRTGGVARSKPPDSDIQEISDHDDEEVEVRRKRKGKAKASELDAIEEEHVPVEKKRANKRKANSEDEDRESVQIIEPRPNQRAKSRARSASQGRNEAPVGARRGRSKLPNSRAGSRQHSTKPMEEDDAEVDGGNEERRPVPKKKRKINAFPTVDTGALAVLANIGINALDIPSSLSPLKQNEPVPPRSLSLVGNLSNIIKFPFQR